MKNKETSLSPVWKSSKRLNAVSIPAEILFYIILGTFSLLCVIPFIFVIIISFTSKNSLSEIGYSFIPNEWSIGAYEYIFKMGALLWKSYFNSFFITIVGTFLSVFVCVLYSYALFRKDFKYRTFFTFFSFFTMMFGGGLVPTYIVCKNVLGLNNNYWALIIPLLVSPFNFIVMRTFFQGAVPNELIESAAIDGSGEYRTLFQIILPISMPGIATIGLLNMLAYWNEWFTTLLYINSETLYPLQYLLMKMQREVDFLSKHATQIGAEAVRLSALAPSDTMRMALVVFIVIPIACAYPFFQRYIISGLTIGSVKG